MPTPFSLACLHHGGLAAESVLSQAGHLAQVLLTGAGVRWAAAIALCCLLAWAGLVTIAPVSWLKFGPDNGCGNRHQESEPTSPFDAAGSVPGAHDIFRGHENILIPFKITRKKIQPGCIRLYRNAVIKNNF